MLLVQKVVSAYRIKFKELFDKWAKEAGVFVETATTTENRGAMALGAEEVSQISPLPVPVRSTAPQNEGAKMKRLKEAWSQTAQEYEFDTPTNEQVAQSSFLGPEISVRDVFRWTSDRSDIDAIVSVFSWLVAELETGTGAATGFGAGASGPLDPASNDMDEGTILELQYLAWKRVAEENSLEAPVPEEVLAAAVLNDPEAVIVRGFGWTDDRSRVSQLAKQYRDYFAENVNERLPHRSYQAPIAEQDPRTEDSMPERNGPTEEEILETQVTAWKEAATVHTFAAPASDQIQLTMNMSANDAVRRLLGWTYNFNTDQINAISATYEEAFKKASQKYVKQYNLAIETVGSSKPIATDETNDLSADELYKAAFDAWTAVARQAGFSLPDQEQVQFAMAVGSEEAIRLGFQWTEDRGEAVGIAEKYREQIKLKRTEWHKKGYSTTSKGESKDKEYGTIPLVTVMPGVASWIRSLLEVEMGCGVTSYLEADQMNALLEYASLAEVLPRDKRVSLNDGYDRDSQQMLGVALRTERRPDHCVVFDSSPYANTAAQEVEMRTVSLVGPYPRYELLEADTSATSVDELTAMNIRRLFGERVYDQPMLDMLQNQPQTTRKVKTKFWDED
jgi:beta-phosphoglucomutase-like phosphatase (HAD superfamily)